MEITWANFWQSPIAVGTLLASITGIGIAVGLEWYRARQIWTERNIQAKVIFAVLVPPLGEISSNAERALNDPRISDPVAFTMALQDQDPVFELPVPDVMIRVFDRLHVLPNAVAVELAALYSDLLGWRRLYEIMADAAGLDPNVARDAPSIFKRVNTTISKIVRAARHADLPVEGLEDIT